MNLEIGRATRKSFEVTYVRVTAENIAAVAKWCNGEVLGDRATGNTPARPYIKVRVAMAKNERQTKAYVGDYVLYAGTGYKVYPSRAFALGFDIVPEDESPEVEEVQEAEEVEEVVPILPEEMKQALRFVAHNIISLTEAV